MVPAVNLDNGSRHTVWSLNDLDTFEDGKVDRSRDVASQRRVEVELHSKLEVEGQPSAIQSCLEPDRKIQLTSARQADRAMINTRNQTMAPRGKVMSRTVPTRVPAIRIGHRTSICSTLV